MRLLLLTLPALALATATCAEPFNSSGGSGGAATAAPASGTGATAGTSAGGSMPGCGQGSVADIHDDFDDGRVDPEIWEIFTMGEAQVWEESGLLQIGILGTAQARTAGVRSLGLYSLDGCQVSVEAKRVFEQVGARLFFRLQASDDDYLETAVEVDGLDGPEIVFSHTLAGAPVDPLHHSFDSSTHRFWRMGVSNGTAFWHTSSDGADWQQKRTTPVPFAVAAVAVSLGASATTLATPAEGHFDNLNR